MRAARATAVGLLALLALPACGGGGGGGDAATDTTFDPAATPTTVAAPAVPPASGGQVEGDLTKAEYISRADALCQGLDDRTADIDFEAKTRAEVVEEFETALVEIETTVSQLRALPLPAGETGPALAMLDGYERGARAFARIPKAFHASGSDFVSRVERIDARLELGFVVGNVPGWRYGFRVCADQPAASYNPVVDGVALAELQQAREEQIAWFYERGRFTEKRRDLLAFDDDVTFVTRLTSLTPGVVYVELADPRTMYLGVESRSGRCLWLRDVEPSEGSDGEEVTEVTYSITETCSSRPANATFDGNFEPPPGCGCGSDGPAERDPEEAKQASFD